MSTALVSYREQSKYTIRTSDRRVFRRCLRKWDHLSSVRKNLKHRGAETNINFWFGSGIHFALEDFHGINAFKDPRRAFYAYYNSFKPDELPMGAEYHYTLAMSMLTYYLTWIEKHNAACGFTTIWFDEFNNVVPPFTPGAKPAVENSFYIPLGITVIADKHTHEIYATYEEGAEFNVSHYAHGFLTREVLSTPELVNGEIIYHEEVTLRWSTIDIDGIVGDKSKEVILEPIMYHGTMDKMVIDKMGRWWVLDYKTAKSADTNKLDTDDQISAYLWAAAVWFNHPIYGFVYQQHTKDMVQTPKRLKNGELSVDKKQKTTYSLLRQELIDDFGSVSQAPSKYIQFLNDLAAAESPEGDRFIRWDFVVRSKEQIETTYENIMGEVKTMLRQDLYCYPNPTRDCIWDCPIRDMCLAIERKDQPRISELLLQWDNRPHTEDGNTDEWRANLKYPATEADLVPMETVLAMDVEIQLDMGDSTGSEGFAFMYEEE